MRPTWGAWGDMEHSDPSLLFYFDGTCEALSNSLRLVAFKKRQCATKTLAKHSAAVFHCVNFLVYF